MSNVRMPLKRVMSAVDTSQYNDVWMDSIQCFVQVAI